MCVESFFPRTYNIERQSSRRHCFSHWKCMQFCFFSSILSLVPGNTKPLHLYSVSMYALLEPWDWRRGEMLTPIGKLPEMWRYETFFLTSQEKIKNAVEGGHFSPNFSFSHLHTLREGSQQKKALFLVDIPTYSNGEYLWFLKDLGQSKDSRIFLPRPYWFFSSLHNHGAYVYNYAFLWRLLFLIFMPSLGLSGAILASAAHLPLYLEVLLGHFTAFSFAFSISNSF